MTEKTNGNTRNIGTPSPGASPKLLAGIAVALIVIYIGILYVLYGSADDKNVSETIWGRYTYVLGGFEAIVFTAVGWLFGREVNRKQAEREEQATQEAAEAKKKGEGLKQAILTHPGIVGDGQEGVADDSMQALLSHARTTEF
jgi:hypothetical protein